MKSKTMELIYQGATTGDEIEDFTKGDVYLASKTIKNGMVLVLNDKAILVQVPCNYFDCLDELAQELNQMANTA